MTHISDKNGKHVREGSYNAKCDDDCFIRVFQFVWKEKGVFHGSSKSMN